ncbi:hypothetical protein [Streptomyces sp. NRRL S-350]|uniref:hypothetical protein n=1 Tax=Streptomyces sp. NRRL S-350 TaxID=1463902 RepID=UPI00131CD7EA|nr:hypothetical protein [Streptomyces sp. NRRL S-350]
MITAQMLWGLHIQFMWPVTMFSPRRREIIRDERTQMTPRHLELRAELDRRRLGLPAAPKHRADPPKERAQMVAAAPREVNVEVVPAEGYELEIKGALSCPFVSTDDMEQQYERVITDLVRDELFIPDDAPLVVIVTDESGGLRRIEQPKRPE